jgi:hypothetical protein
MEHETIAGTLLGHYLALGRKRRKLVAEARYVASELFDRGFGTPSLKGDLVGAKELIRTDQEEA